MIRRALALTVGLIGVVAALALPFAPVMAQQATVTWPAAGRPAASTTVLFAPYRPQELIVKVPLAELRSPAPGAAITVLATSDADDGLTVETSSSEARVRFDGHDVAVPAGDGDGYLTLHADGQGITVSDTAGWTQSFPDARVPRVFGFRTDLPAEKTAGMSVTGRTSSVFATSPTPSKLLLIVAQLAAAGAALALLLRDRRRVVGVNPAPAEDASTETNGRVGRAAVDAGVIAVLAVWAVVGPLAVDDGWATTIARTYAASGNPGNYYRWWNASEAPFALWEQMIAPLTAISVAPMWLRLVSTLLAVATWLVLSRGVLGAALPALAPTARLRAVAAICFVAAWMPFNLGVRPEGMVALGVTAVLALLWRARGLGAVGVALLIAALTLAASPTAVVILAPFIVFAPSIVRLLRTGTSTRGDLPLRLLLLAAIAAVFLTVVFADQTWDGVVTATGWHRFFGPSLSWYDEPDRYRYLLGDDQMGSFAKRLPVLLSAALVPVVGLLLLRRRGAVAGAAARMGAVVVISVALLSLAPSKWSYHLGALAGVLAAFLVVALVLVVHRTDSAGVRRDVVIGLVAAGLAVGAAAVGFAGPNSWWMQDLYLVPWVMVGPQPLGLPLRSVILWCGLLLVGYTVAAIGWRARGAGAVRGAIATGPAVLVLIALIGSVVVMMVSFVSAPLRRPAGSLAESNLRWLSGRPSCGFADSVDVLADGDILTTAETAYSSTGFTALGGFAPDAPPPDAPGTGMSTYLWGSRDAPPGPAMLTSQWFTLPPLKATEGLSASVVGPAGAATVWFEFGRADESAGPQIVPLGRIDTTDPAPPDVNARRRVWRAVTVDAVGFPAGADRVRLHVDAMGGPANWVAVTGPRRHTSVRLTDFLPGRGPVLLSWPQSFVFPCVHDIVRVADGIAQTPKLMIVAPGPWFTEPQDVRLGGVFAGLQPYGRLYE
ncbi:MAG: hypothetical protein QOH57_5291, partial [Mycobacterium sp.]|nr:hypothetical protein [Mycobacterium sp.]